MPDQARVVIPVIERLFPAAVFAFAGIAGLAGSILAFLARWEVRTMQLPSFHVLAVGIARMDLVEISLLILSALIAIAASILLIIRSRSSPASSHLPGSWVLSGAVLSIIPILLLIAALLMPYDAFGSAATAGRSAEYARLITPILIAAAFISGITVLSAVLLAALPFKATPQRRTSPTVFLFVLALILFGFTVVFAWQWYDMTRPMVVY